MPADLNPFIPVTCDFVVVVVVVGFPDGSSL